MTTTQAGAVLRHIHRLAARQSAAADDRQLLERFTAGRDEAAFAELVRRHGPMVLGVCRRVLRNLHDAEDGFQATFLMLARKAAVIGRRGSVGGWLYQVAYTTALKAKERAAARQRHEQRAAGRAPADPLDEVSGRELLAVLDQELAALPERLRVPLVLSFLEGQTRDEAARALGCSLGTLKRRLEEGRQQLRARLGRRGLALSAALLATGVVAPPLPAALAAATARAAAEKAAVVSAAVAALVRPVPAARASRAVGAVLVAVGLVAVGAGLLAARGPALGGPAAADEPQGARAGAKEPPAPVADEKKELAFVGRVVGADGRPAAGADVALLGEARSNPPNTVWLGSKVLAHGRADADGKFRLTAARAALADYREVYVIAGKAGHGPAWALAELKTPSPETLVRLAPEKIVRGRLLDLQGQPAVGVRVSVSYLYDPSSKGHVLVNALSKEGFPAWPGPATTDKDGKFTLAGLNPDLDGSLVVDGEEFATARAEIKAGREHRNQEVNLTLAPARILEGVVTAKDTGKPVPKARVLCLEGGMPVYAQTDEKGRYRLRVPVAADPGLPTGVSTTPPEGQPYLPGEAPLEWPKGAVKHRIDLVLERGVFVRGTVTDAATGQPIAGAVAGVYLPKFEGVLVPSMQVTAGPDGTFAVVVPPGRRGHVLVKGPNNDYIAGEITTGELSGGKRAGYRAYPDAVIPFETKAGTEALDVMTVKLRRGVTLRGKLLGPGDKPAADALMVCWNHGTKVPVRDGVFELRGCDPEVTYPVYFLDARNKLGATARLSAKESGGKEVTVRLEPCGSAALRFVDKDKKLLPAVRPYFYMVARPGNNRPGDKDVKADRDFASNVDGINYSGRMTAVDKEGYCVYPVLIPAATYQLLARDFKTIKELTVKPGEALKMDVVIEAPQ
jgi:RNA polymerase sigma factor (sigma-70 family)